MTGQAKTEARKDGIKHSEDQGSYARLPI